MSHLFLKALTKLQIVNEFIIDYTMHAEQRERLIDTMAKDFNITSGIILLQGGKAVNEYDTDGEPLFHQESNFHYLFGMKESNCYGLIDITTKKTHIFVPRLPKEYAVWMGKINPPSFFVDLYKVDAGAFVDELETVIKSFNCKIIYTLHGLNTDSGLYAEPAQFDGIEKYRVDNGALYEAIVKCRVYKTPKEIQLMRFVNDVTCDAHMAVMKYCKAGYKEFQMESVFQHWCYFKGGSRFQAYTCICASGDNGAVLHYGHAGEPNSKTIQKGEMCLFDMGCEYHCYASDVTCSFPTDKHFTEKNRIIYQAVLDAQWAVMDAMRPGVSWPSMQELSYTVILTRLKEAGLLVGDVKDMIRDDIGHVFMPHGLGHLMGLDTHDVGGYAKGCPERSAKPGFKSLRTSRVLEENMVISVEPGIYFSDYSLDTAFESPIKSKYLVKDKVNAYRGFGGVRLEDDVLITKDGIENFSSAPRTIEDVEKVMNGKINNRKELTLKYYRTS